MASVTLLNKLAKYRYVRIDELMRGKRYPIKKFVVYVDTQYDKGNCVRVDLVDEGYIILPQRFNELLEGDTLETMNSQKLAFVFHGKTKNVVDISFELIEDQTSSSSSTQ